MITRAAERRAHAAALARRYFYERSVPLSTLEETFRDARDPLIEELIELATHEPPPDDRAHYERKYWPHVEAVLEQLDLGDKGTLPPAGRWSLLKVAGLAGTVLVFGTLAAMRLLNNAEADDSAGIHWAIYAVLAAIAFPAVLGQYLKARRRRRSPRL
ncbi:MAG TPA: hypothetical protein VKB93_13090 [Thermoanaerobaculia bacterium]|nr:hypothetical protein [Thermoanaerobaculia bacterium]